MGKPLAIQNIKPKMDILAQKAVDAFFHDWVSMPKLEKLGQLTCFHLLNVDGVLSISVDWVELKSCFSVPN